MSGLLKDSGWDGLRVTVEGCDDCEGSTIHLTAPGGVAVCSLCGYNPLLAELADEDEAGYAPSNVSYLPDYYYY